MDEQRAETARQYVANYRRLTKLIDQMTLLNMGLLKGTAVRKLSKPVACAGLLFTA